MAKKMDEPMVRVSRVCIACRQVFILSHPSDPRRLCEKCEMKLIKLINEVRDVD